MVENKTDFYQNPIIVDSNGKRYALNPFARKESNTEDAVPELYSLLSPQCELSFPNITEYDQDNDETPCKTRSHYCQYCNSAFQRKDHLKRHIRSIHSKQKLYLCPVCNIDCKKDETLQKHVKMKHAGRSEVFNCHECLYHGDTFEDLKQHELKHLLTDRHMCPHCDTTFKRRDHMLRHIKSQHLNQFVLCPVCGQAYKRRDHVARHVREKHGMTFANGKLITTSET